MKITFLLPYAGLAGGIRVAAIYAERLARRGHEVRVISQPLPRPTWHDRARHLLRKRQWLSVPRRGPGHFDHVDVPHTVLERYRPVTDADVPDADVVVATWWETAEWAAALSPAKGAKAYFIQHHEVMFPGQNTARIAATWRLPMHKITISRWLVDLARDTYGDADVSFVPNSVDLQQFHAPPRGRQPVPTVGTLYSTADFKGYADALAAIRLAMRRFPTLRTVVFGAERPTSALPLPDPAQFTLRPAQDRIKDLYAQCDVWLCGSRGEGFHLPPLEAMACRCPVVSTRVGGPLDIIRDGVNGFVVDVQDTAALADRLIEVLDSPDARWRAMSDQACATAAAYTWDDATMLFEQALERAMQTASAPKPQ